VKKSKQLTHKKETKRTNDKTNRLVRGHGEEKEEEENELERELASIISDALRDVLPEIEELTKQKDQGTKKARPKAKSNNSKKRKGRGGQAPVDKKPGSSSRADSPAAETSEASPDEEDVFWDPGHDDDLIVTDGVLGDVGVGGSNIEKRDEGGRLDRPTGFVKLEDSFQVECNVRDDLAKYFHVELSMQWNIVPMMPRRSDFEHIKERFLGMMEPIKGHALKMKCTRHSDCSLILPCEGRFRFIECVLVQWALVGWAQHFTAADHTRIRDQLREMYGRKPHSAAGKSQARGSAKK